MKGIFVIIDGAADESLQEIGGKTPLEAAKTPNLDYFAERGEINYCHTVKLGVAPESSSAIVALLGNDPNFAPRGPFEALGAGIKISEGDLALRCNFATIDSLEKGTIIDSRAGRTLTTKEARILAKTINEKVKLPFRFRFYPTIGHRGVLVFKGGFSDNISNADPFYGEGRVINRTGATKIVFSQPLDDEDDSKLSADMVNMFIRKSYEVLDKHPVNRWRVKKGQHPANFILCRDAGNEPAGLKLRGKWMALAYMPLEIGIAKAAKMDAFSFKYPELKGTDVYGTFYLGLRKAILNAKKMLKNYRNRYDYFYVHFKETDLPGHDGKARDKIKMIEMIDKIFFSFLRKFLKGERMVVTADHTTSCKIKAHTADPVPVLVFGSSGGKRGKRFTEEEGRNGRKIVGRELLEKTLFVK